MKTIFDYLNYYNNVTFEKYYFNDMDNIVFSMLAYLPFKEKINKKTINIKEALNCVKEQQPSKSIKWASVQILNIISKGERYKDITFSNYISIVDDKTQFGAITIRFNKNSCFVAFKGTDNSLTGWKENLCLSYKYPVAAQTLAVNYLRNTIKTKDKIIYVGGHSKGGNLAMASVMGIDDRIYHKINTIYNNDGPGFKKEQFDSLKFKKIEKKLINFIPEESIVGILLYNKKPYVVKSEKRGIMQHYPTNWDCFGGFLVDGKLSKTSSKMQKQFNEFLEATDNKSKKLMINTLFDIFKKNNIIYFNQLSDLNIGEISNMLKETKNIDETSRQILIDMLKVLIFNNKK